jgi:hypothetical protein
VGVDRIAAQFKALRYFASNGTRPPHPSEADLPLHRPV